MCEERDKTEEVKIKGKTYRWKRDNDIMQNFASHLIGPLTQLRDGLVEERKRLMQQRKDWKRQNLNG